MIAGIFAGGANTIATTTPLDVELLADSPWCYYRLTDTAPVTAYVDSISARNLGVIAPTLTPEIAGLCAPGECVDFDGAGYVQSSNNQYGTAQATAFNGNKAITMCGVAEVDSLAATAAMFHIGNMSYNGGQGVYVTISSAGAVVFSMRDTVSASFKSISTPDGTVSVGVPFIYHCRRGVSGPSAIFINGVLQATGTMSGNIGAGAHNVGVGARMTIGALNANTPSNRFDGRLQHIAAFTSALSDARIAAHAAAAGF